MQLMKLYNLFQNRISSLHLPLRSLALCGFNLKSFSMPAGDPECSQARSSEPSILVGTNELIRPSFDEVEAGLQVFQRLLHGLVLHVHECQALVCAAITRLGV